MTAPELRGFLTPGRRDELLDALTALVEAALRHDPTSRDATVRLDKAAARWSRGVALPSDVVTLVAEVRRERRPSRRREDVLERVALVAVAAVAERQVREALTDPLTGLATRARMEDEAQHLLAMSLRAGSPLTAVILDVDGLKKINDEQGHAAGDAALSAVGRAIREHARKTDRAFRWGGDEFLILMPGTTDQDAHLVVERIQQGCATSVSAGVAVHAHGASEVDVATWLSEADADLYRRRRAARGVKVPRQRRMRPGGHASGAALLGLATVAAATGGLLTATSVGHGTHGGTTTQATGTPGTHVRTAGSGTITRPVISTPTAVQPVVLAQPVAHRATRTRPALTPPRVMTPPLPHVVTPPGVTSPPASTDVPVTPEPEPVGLVTGLVRTVGGVLRSVVNA